MKTKSIVLASVVALMASACATNTGPSASAAGYVPTSNATEIERRILVTFADRSIGRGALADPGASYRRHGGYYTTAYSRQIVSALGHDYGLTMVTDWPVTTVGVHCVVFEVAQDRSVSDVMEELGKDSRVGGVQRMRKFRVLNDPYTRFQPALESMQVLDAHRWSTGTGVTVAVIDTGVDTAHPDLKGQVISNEDMVGVESATAGKDIHGTAVAGLIGALADNNEGIVGVAPGAKLLAYRACWQESASDPAATCDTYTLAKALNNAIAKKPNVINLSLTGPEDPLLSLLIKKALEEHIIVVAAAPDKKEATVGFPASVPGVIAAQAAYDEAQKSSLPAEESGFFAPGNRVFTTFPQHTYNFISGNSFAAAHVSGVIALLLSLKPEMSLDEIELALKQSSAKTAFGVKQISTQINACAAVVRLHAGGDCNHKHS